MKRDIVPVLLAIIVALTVSIVGLAVWGTILAILGG